MVRVAGLERQVAAGLATRSPDGRVPGAVAGRDSQPGHRHHQPSGGPVVRRIGAGAGRRGHLRLGGGRLQPRGAGRPGGVVRQHHLPRAHAAGGRPRPAVPLYLRPLPELGGAGARFRDRRGALGAGQGTRGPGAVRRGRLRAATGTPGAGDRPLPAVALPGHGGARARLLPRHPRRRFRAVRRGRRPAGGGRDRAAPPPLRRCRAAGGFDGRLGHDADLAQAGPGGHRPAGVSHRRAWWTWQMCRSWPTPTGPSSSSSRGFR